MNNYRLLFVLSAVGFGFVAFVANAQGLLLAAGEYQDPVHADKVEVVVLPPQRDPAWGVPVVDNHIPSLLVKVPPGRRFVLTDLRPIPHEEFPVALGPKDHIWLEDGMDGKRFRALEGTVESVGMPLKMETGLSFGPGHELWAQYTLATNKNDAMLRLFWSGYFEDVAAQP